MDGDQEIWKAIPDWEKYYIVSNLGNVKSLPRNACGSRKGHRYLSGRILKKSQRKDGYLYVRLSVDSKSTHKRINRLVCEAFHGSPPSIYHQAAHNDGNRANNFSDNLRWATRIENMKDCFVHGTMKRGEKSHASKLTLKDVSYIKYLGSNGFKIKDIAYLWDASRSHTAAIIRGADRTDAMVNFT